jgi:formyltetrahydrofolate synthetase
MAYSHNSRVASSVKLADIADVARKAGIAGKYIKKYGDHVAKVSAEELLQTLKKRKAGKHVMVTSITPTQMGEGKTVTTIGLSMALNKLKKRSIACIRQPSLGPTFGIKGSGSGGGLCQVLPQEELGLYLTGDTYAAEAAQNLCAAMLDNCLFWGDKGVPNKDDITWKRVSDISDRALRIMSICGGGKLHGVNRRTGMDITPSGECMAVLSLSESLKNMRDRIGSIVLGYDPHGKPVRADDIRAAGPMTVLMKSALNPNLLQTVEHTPCFVHTGAFANTSHGSSSVIADKLAMKLADYTITESGFGADLGAEKFIDIKCRQSGLSPDAIVINCSVRALKVHSGDFHVKGSSLPPELKKENLSAVDRGCSNLEKQVENLKLFGIPIVVSINRFDSDSKKELDVVFKRVEALDVNGAAICDAYRAGSSGALDLAREVMRACSERSKMRFLYPVDMTLESKIERVAKSMYGASEVKYSEEALKSISRIAAAGLDKMPVCMAKTHLSLTNNPDKKGRPKGFRLLIEDLIVFAGAGYVLALCEGVNTMPGMPKAPRSSGIDIDVKTGAIKGLF